MLGEQAGGWTTLLFHQGRARGGAGAAGGGTHAGPLDVSHLWSGLLQSTQPSVGGPCAALPVGHWLTPPSARSVSAPGSCGLTAVPQLGASRERPWWRATGLWLAPSGPPALAQCHLPLRASGC